MKRLLKKSLGAAIAAILVTTPIAAPSFAETVTLADTTFDTAATGKINATTIEDGNVTVDSASWTIDDTVFKGGSGKSLKLTGSNKINLWTKSRGVSEVEFDFRTDNFTKTINFYYIGTVNATTNTTFAAFSVKADASDGGIITVSGSDKTVAVAAGEWHKFRTYFDAANQIVSLYIDDSHIYSYKKSGLTYMTRLNANIPTDATVNFDNLKITQYDPNAVTVSANNSQYGNKTVADYYNQQIAVDITGYTNAESANILISADNEAFTLYKNVDITGTRLTAAVPSGYVKVQLLSEDSTVIGSSDSVYVPGLAGELVKCVSSNFKSITDGWNVWLDRYKNNPAGAGAYNPNELTVGVAGSATGYDFEDGVYDETLVLNSTAATQARIWPLNCMVGYTKTAYSDLAGTTYAEKFPQTYAVIEGSYRFPDFNSNKNLMKPWAVGVNNSERAALNFLSVRDDGNGKGKLIFNDNDTNVLATMEKDTWYNIKNIIDMKNGKQYVFVNGDYIACADSILSMIYQINALEVNLAKPSTGESKMYYDNFAISTLTFPCTIEDAVFYINNTETTDISDGALREEVCIRNDGEAKTMYVITAVYEDSTMKKVSNVDVTKVSFAAGDLQKTATIVAGDVTAQNCVKSMFFRDMGSLLPLRDANILD